jgi:hypothetical protein
MKMGDEDVGIDRLVGELCCELLAEVAETSSAIEYVDLSVDADLYAGGIASVPHVLHLRSGRGTPHTPKLYVHALLVRRLPDLVAHIENWVKPRSSTGADELSGLAAKQRRQGNLESQCVTVLYINAMVTGSMKSMAVNTDGYHGECRDEQEARSRIGSE